jgi:hypothetical protein
VGNPNGISLAEAQRRYERYGSVHPNDAQGRDPRADEARDAAWKPVDDPTGNQYHDYVRDLAFLVVQAAERARDEVRQGGDEQVQGRLSAWREAMELLVCQANVFDLSVDDIGPPGGLDPSVDLAPQQATDRYAG